MFTELVIKTLEENHEIFIAELAELGYESFTEHEEALQAYIETSDFNEQKIKALQGRYQTQMPFLYHYKTWQKANWNEDWEKNYHPIEIVGQVHIRAMFHEPKPEFAYEICITPKMSFGTGHHETTSLMIENQLTINHQNKKVLDAGTGTGILAIMAHLLGATYIEAFDNDEWAVENSLENAELNHATKHIKVYLGTIEAVKPQKFDIIIANINKNVLLADISAYARLLSPKAYLLLSGFYENDVEDILKIARQNGLQFVAKKTKNKWVSLICELA